MLWIKRRKTQDLSTKLQKGPQSIENPCHPCLATTSLLYLASKTQDMPNIQPRQRLVPYITYHPIQCLPVARYRERGAPHFVVCPFQKRGSIMPMLRGGVPSALSDMCPAQIGNERISTMGLTCSLKDLMAKVLPRSRQ